MADENTLRIESDVDMTEATGANLLLLRIVRVTATIIIIVIILQRIGIGVATKIEMKRTGEKGSGTDKMIKMTSTEKDTKKIEEITHNIFQR